MVSVKMGPAVWAENYSSSYASEIFYYFLHSYDRVYIHYQGCSSNWYIVHNFSQVRYFYNKTFVMSPFRISYRFLKSQVHLCMQMPSECHILRRRIVCHQVNCSGAHPIL